VDVGETAFLQLLIESQTAWDVNPTSQLWRKKIKPAEQSVPSFVFKKSPSPESSPPNDQFNYNLI